MIRSGPSEIKTDMESEKVMDACSAAMSGLARQKWLRASSSV